jgi:hypothetical protein
MDDESRVAASTAAASTGVESGVADTVADQLLERLERIDELRRSSTPAAETGGALLGELRALVGDAEAWARAEGDGRARAAVEKLREKAEGMR